MSDDKKPPKGIGDIDWDRALAEWESDTFFPEVAKDLPSDKIADAPVRSLPRPLYRPPAPSSPESPRTPKPLVSPTLSSTEGARRGNDDEEDDENHEDEGATIVAEIPQELLRGGNALARSGSRGGLGQLFAREERRDGSALTPADSGPTPSRRASSVEMSAMPGESTARPTRSAPGPVLIAPEARHFDPNDVTKATHLAAGGRQPGSHEAERRQVNAGHSPIGTDARRWADERPASEWLTAERRQAFASRAEWLESEARASADGAARARGLLACSEILATMGDLDRARVLAIEARDLAPTLDLAHWQSRTLMPFRADPSESVEALDAHASVTPEGPARVHVAWLAANALHAAGRDDAVAQRLEHAARLSLANPDSASDLRPAIALAVRALSRNETASPSLRLPHAGALAPIADAAEVCLRLRGVDRSEAFPDDVPQSEWLLRVRQALDQGDVPRAVALLSRLGQLPELSGAATWLAATLGDTRADCRGDAARWFGELSRRGDRQASGALMACAIELGDQDLLATAMAARGTMPPAERVALSILGGLPLPELESPLAEMAGTTGMEPLGAAAAAVTMARAGNRREGDISARADRTAGAAESRACVRLGRLLSSSAPAAETEAALGALDPAGPAARALNLEMAARAGRSTQVAEAIERWGARRASADDGAMAPLAAALVAEAAGDVPRALESFKAARLADPTNEAALRAVAALEPLDMVAEMNSLADDRKDGLASAMARIEAVTRGEEALPEPTRADLLERAHRTAPTFPLAAFLAERMARRSGDVDDAVRWARERRAHTSDSVELAFDNVREARLLADREPAVAAERLEEAHRACPSDIALRELYERFATEPPADRGAWRERRAADVAGDARTVFLLEAAREHERVGHEEAALRCAEAATHGGAMGRVARERAELRSGRVARLADELLALAKSATDPQARCEAYERLADLDGRARRDAGSALLWHRAILEELPEHLPSLRHVEHHLIGEGRDDELEPVASAIARVLRGKGAGESGAHAELAARLRARGAQGNWEATCEMAELAAAEAEPSLWSLRRLQAHARARADDSVYLAVTLRLIERSTRPAETATLLVRAAEAALRLQRLDDARSLLERATREDPGDIVAWGLLIDLRRLLGDRCGAAEACEALARSSHVPEHQLSAWYEAARTWCADGNDEERAIVALETAATIDVAYEDVFERLSSLYASRKMQPELANLLERRLVGIDDAEERLALEVRRGRILLEVGDADGARRAFESALIDHPDDGVALSAFADLCVTQRDWETAEQALVRLARLLPTVEEQRSVYSRLGDLYARQLLNLSRAEVSFIEVLKRAPGDERTMEKLVDVYRRQSDPARAIPLQQQLIGLAQTPVQKRDRIIELANVYEHTAHDNRRAEQTLEAARREFAQDVEVLRALTQFHVRHGQTVAAEGLLDGAGEEAQRLLGAGRMSSQLLEVVATVFELRGNRAGMTASRVMLAALEGRPEALRGVGARAFDPTVDDQLAPDVLNPALRALLARAGDALDAASPIELPALNATPVPATSAVGRLAAGIAQAMSLGEVQVLASPRLGSACIPIRSSPPVILVGGALAEEGHAAAFDDQVVVFLLVRALKLVSAKASALTRTAPAELAVLIAAWLQHFHPTWQPVGVDSGALGAAHARLRPTLSLQPGPDVRASAIEASKSIGTHAASLGGNALAWANRVALLALGNPGAALDAIAGSNGSTTGAPRDEASRLAWVLATAEARDLLAFGAGPRFAQAQSRLGVDMG